MSTWVRSLLVAAVVGAALGASTQVGMDGSLERGMFYEDSELEDPEEMEDLEVIDEILPFDDDRNEMKEPAQQQEGIADDEEESWRSRADWWKDPLGYFEEEEKNEAVTETASVTEDFEIEPEESIPEGQAESIQDSQEKEKQAEFQRPVMSKKTKSEKTQDSKEDKSARKKRTKENSRKNQVSKELRTLRNSFSAPAASLLPIIPKVRSFITTYPPVQLLGVAFLIKSLFTNGAKKIVGKQLEEEHEDENPMPQFNERNYEDEFDDNHDADATTTEPGSRANQKSPRMPAFFRDKGAHDVGFLERIVNMVPSGGNRHKIPSAKQLMEERETLLQRVDTAETERDNMEREYEKTSWQLQEVQTDLTAQASTTRYLKAQLRDCEQMLERAVRAERDRAREELKRMKEAMLRVLERERQAMRDEVKRQTAELQALLNEANGVDHSNAPPLPKDI